MAKAKKASGKKLVPKVAKGKKARGKKAAPKIATTKKSEPETKKVGAGEENALTTQEPKHSQRITQMTLQEVLISVATLQDRWKEFNWLQGIYLYGDELTASDTLTTLKFMVVYRGLRRPHLMRKARMELAAFLKPALPLPRNLNFTDDAAIIAQIASGNPAVEALLGRAVPIYVC